MEGISVQADSIIKSFGAAEVLKGVDLRIQRGTVYSLLGPNGAGKTTLVRILSTLLRPDGGTASVEGHDVVREPSRVRTKIGLTGQYASVDELLTGEENLRMVGRLLGQSRRTAKRRGGELLERFDLTSASGRRVRTYSGGMRRRLDLAASLMGNPPVVFLDEPTTGLDPASRRGLWEVIRAMVGAGVTILLTTQYLEEADQLADRIAVLNEGVIALEGTLRELKQQVGSERLGVTVSDRAALAVAADLMADRSPHLAEESRMLTVPIHHTDEVRHLLNLFAERDVTVTEVALSAPTLDDVFFAVTNSEDLRRVS